MSGQSRHRPLHRILSALGELLVTVGVLLALFAVYELWWTNVTANRAAAHAQSELVHTWQSGGAPPSVPPGVSFDIGSAIGILHVPAMGTGYTVLVKEGTGASVLNQGVAGHYTSPKSALPWEGSGNFAVAAHRDGHGAKFHNIDRLKAGDPIVLETRDTWYVYRVDKVLPRTARDNVAVIDPVPQQAGYTAPGRYITLTSCTPPLTSLYRIIVWGHLVDSPPVDARRTPPSVLG